LVIWGIRKKRRARGRRRGGEQKSSLKDSKIWGNHPQDSNRVKFHEEEATRVERNSALVIQRPSVSQSQNQAAKKKNGDDMLPIHSGGTETKRSARTSKGSKKPLLNMGKKS